MDKATLLKLLGQSVAAMTALIVTLLLLRSIPWVTSKSWLHLILIPMMLLGMHYRTFFGTYGRAALLGLVLATSLIYSFDIVGLIRANVAQPPEYDIQQFWLHGRVAVQGLNYYEPEHAITLAQTFQPSEAMLAELRFWYPPPTMFLFLPLGWLDIQTAALYWQLAHLILLMASIYMTWRLFLKNDGGMGLALAAALILALHPSLSTVRFGQLNFIVLLMLLLFWQDLEQMRGGVWLAVAIFTKPYMAIVLLYLTLRRKWSVLAGTFLTMSVLSILAIIVFGPTTFFSYFFMNPAATSTNNLTVAGSVSLLGILSRLVAIDNTNLLINPLYIVPAILLMITSGLIIYRISAQHSQWALVLTLPLSLLLYPITGEHYMVILIVPFLLLWTYRDKVQWGAWIVSFFIAIEYTAFRFQDGQSIFVFLAILLAWSVLAVIGGWLIRYPSEEPHAKMIYAR